MTPALPAPGAWAHRAPQCKPSQELELEACLRPVFEQQQKPEGLRERPRARAGRAGLSPPAGCPGGTVSSHLWGCLSVTHATLARHPSFLCCLHGPWPGWNPRWRQKLLPQF